MLDIFLNTPEKKYSSSMSISTGFSIECAFTENNVANISQISDGSVIISYYFNITDILNQRNLYLTHKVYILIKIIFHYLSSQ